MRIVVDDARPRHTLKQVLEHPEAGLTINFERDIIICF